MSVRLDAGVGLRWVECRGRRAEGGPSSQWTCTSRSSTIKFDRCKLGVVRHMDFTFLPRWKEELVCSSSLGEVILEMPMGVPSIYLPTEAVWQDSAPEWARPHWKSIHLQLKAWCALHDLPLFVDDTASVFIQ